MSVAYLTRRVGFAAAHRYRRPEWDDATNEATFGPCAHPNFHGHSYVCDVTVRGPIDPRTGFCVDLALLDRVLAEEVRARFDHRNLNLDVAEFADGLLVPTGENLARLIFDRVGGRIPAEMVEVVVAEDETLRISYRGGVTDRTVGAILAGGAASRFGGQAKGLVRVDGRRVIDRVYATLRHTGARPFVVSGRPDAGGWLPGAQTVADQRPGCGSLGGIHTALLVAEELGAAGVYVVAWDMPFVSAVALVRLRDAACDGMAAIPVHPDGRLEPLCAWYAAGCLTTAVRLLDRGERRAGALADEVGAVRVPVAVFSGAARLFVNINTPDDLVRARRRDRGTPRPAILA